MVADGGVYCVQSVEAKDAVTAKHPPIATLGRESSGSSLRCQFAETEECQGSRHEAASCPPKGGFVDSLLSLRKKYVLKTEWRGENAMACLQP